MIKSKKGQPLKKYLNSAEILDMMYVARLLDSVEAIKDIWDDRRNFDYEEIRKLDAGIKNIRASFMSIVGRMGYEKLNSFKNRYKDFDIRLIDNYVQKKLDKELREKLEKHEKNNEHYLDLLELTFDSNCKGCTKSFAECDLYNHLELNSVMELDPSHHKDKKCKFAYELEHKNK